MGVKFSSSFFFFCFAILSKFSVFLSSSPRNLEVLLLIFSPEIIYKSVIISKVKILKFVVVT